MTSIHVDVMTQGGEKYYDSFTFQHDPIFGKLWEELKEAFQKRFPTLKNRKDIVLHID